MAKVLILKFLIPLWKTNWPAWFVTGPTADWFNTLEFIRCIRITVIWSSTSEKLEVVRQNESPGQKILASKYAVLIVQTFDVRGFKKSQLATTLTELKA